MTNVKTLFSTLILHTLVVQTDEYRWFQQSSGPLEVSGLCPQSSKECVWLPVHRRFLEAVQQTQRDTRLAEEAWLSATLRPRHLTLAKPTDQQINRHQSYTSFLTPILGGMVAQWVERWTCDQQAAMLCGWEGNRRPGGNNGNLPPGGWMFTCGLTACTPGSAPGQTLGNEYENPLPLTDASEGTMHNTIKTWRTSAVLWHWHAISIFYLSSDIQ